MFFRSAPKVRPGDAAPAFQLPAHDGSVVRLVELRARRRVLLSFYVEDDTPACTAGLQALQEALPRFQALGTEVLAVSHNLRDSQARFAAKLGLRFRLLSDPAGDVATAYGARGRMALFHPKSFVIDGRGVLRLILPGRPDVQKLLLFLDGLRGDVDPASGGATP